MSADHGTITSMDVDVAFVKSKRGILKVAEMVTLFVAFVCFTVGSRPEYITASVMEFLITSLLLSLYLFKLNKRLTFFFWPLVDMVNSVLAAVFFTVLSLVALITYHVTGTLVGGIVTFMSAALLCVDSYTLFRSITFNKRRGESQSQGSGAVNGGAADHP
ncbi:Chemokine-like factor isoform 2 [Scophthalmus maximus]|uniref:Chemokine-like factor isoform 2 n=1 Tax=Scophthalmus maximus TaxID=52904 RepID=A0A2U9BCC9_SCOMX|nr:proteolipid protein 2 isoform X1 [Scophthalmus maximus]AWP01449.1 Chemokine-like factor isoform 2 [Scophthalmus maximus]